MKPIAYIVSKLTFDRWGNLRLDERSTEAIPIEWIKKWVEKCNWHYTDLPRIIETMLEDWKKENEID